MTQYFEGRRGTFWHGPPNGSVAAQVTWLAALPAAGFAALAGLAALAVRAGARLAGLAAFLPLDLARLDVAGGMAGGRPSRAGLKIRIPMRNRARPVVRAVRARRRHR